MFNSCVVAPVALDGAAGKGRLFRNSTLGSAANCSGVTDSSGTAIRTEGDVLIISGKLDHGAQLLGGLCDAAVIGDEEALAFCNALSARGCNSLVVIAPVETDAAPTAPSFCCPGSRLPLSRGLLQADGTELVLALPVCVHVLSSGVERYQGVLNCTKAAASVFHTPFLTTTPM